MSLFKPSEQCGRASPLSWIFAASLILHAYKEKGGAEKAFSLQEQLTGGDYYFNCRLDTNDYCNPNPDMKPSLEGNILSVLCVKSSGDYLNYNSENLFLKIDMESEKNNEPGNPSMNGSKNFIIIFYKRVFFK